MVAVRGAASAVLKDRPDEVRCDPTNASRKSRISRIRSGTTRSVQVKRTPGLVSDGMGCRVPRPLKDGVAVVFCSGLVVPDKPV